MFDLWKLTKNKLFIEKHIFQNKSLWNYHQKKISHKEKKCDHPKTNNNSLCFQQLPIGKVSYVDNALHSVMWLKEAPLQIMYSHFHQPIRNYREKLRNAAHLVGTHFIYLQNNCAKWLDRNQLVKSGIWSTYYMAK